MIRPLNVSLHSNGVQETFGVYEHQELIETYKEYYTWKGRGGIFSLVELLRILKQHKGFGSLLDEVTRWYMLSVDKINPDVTHKSEKGHTSSKPWQTAKREIVDNIKVANTVRFDHTYIYKEGIFRIGWIDPHPGVRTGLEFNRTNGKIYFILEFTLKKLEHQISRQDIDHIQKNLKSKNFTVSLIDEALWRNIKCFTNKITPTSIEDATKLLLTMTDILEGRDYEL